MNAIVLLGISAICAYFVGCLLERARGAHQVYDAYRTRVGTNLRQWISDSTKAYLITIGLVVLFLAIVLK